MDENLGSVVDSGPSEPSPAPEPVPVDPAPEPSPAPEPAPVDPSPEPSPAPEPVEPVSPSPVGPTPSDPSEGVVSPGEDPSVGDAEQQPGEDQQQPGEQLPGEQLPGVDLQQPGEQLPPVGTVPQIVYSLPQQQLNTPEELVLDNVETYQLSPITDSTGLKGVLLRIIGPYDNIVTQYRYQQSSNQYYTYVNEVTPDYPWIASAALFIVLLVSLFGLLKRSMSWMK